MDNFQSGLLSLVFDAVISKGCKASKFVYKSGFRQPQLFSEGASKPNGTMSLAEGRAVTASSSRHSHLHSAGESFHNDDQGRTVRSSQSQQDGRILQHAEGVPFLTSYRSEAC
ncbi:hypothetical protein RvY_18398 [Ramazzottius varieornatus]|uniref:Uncharacterized protein n=1 Tax=Ramazzottius varieornatus TaxID=947166 RepID=A0A1D1W5M5_RAMVA|nr:hypothetical protein RvY_18398 [Ramazzottius varieornatus]